MILVTGGAGYVGSHMVLALAESGYDVVIFDNLETSSQAAIEVFNKIKLRGTVEFFRGDLRNQDDLRLVFKKYRFEAVMHFAAYIQVYESVIDPKKYYNNNVVGTANLLEVMIENGVNRLIFSSTAAVYGNAENSIVDETSTLCPQSPYGSSKMMAEKIMDDYGQAYGLKSVRFRYFNVVGADEHSRIGERHLPETHLVPRVIKAVLAGEEFELYGDNYQTVDGTCVRDYIDIYDLVNAHILGLRHLSSTNTSEIFNLGTGVGNTVKEVLASCFQTMGQSVPIVVKPRRAGDPDVLVASNSKAKRVLGWNLQKGLKDSIKTAYNWEQKMFANGI